MAVNEQFHIHISFDDKGNLLVERVYTDGNVKNETLCSVACTNELEEGYEPIYHEYTEVVVEAGDEIRVMPTNDGTVIAVLRP